MQIEPMPKPQAQPQDKYVLRLPDGMRDRIKAAAERNGRSMNAEIVATLDEKYPRIYPISALIKDIEEFHRIAASGPNHQVAEHLANVLTKSLKEHPEYWEGAEETIRKAIQLPPHPDE
ncbi:Arc-like DNA binding domain-containing protein [Devosia enhydra]|uniref:Arc-like DNA binding domain-containing protein n=1 Tax=Devosia enhydra TaxID=665118 RepID=A0A1K2HWH2_9HYPH|nr:Arc family DNA-binding protein [Devosia enhydra]SFZ82394.1 Arc-like DNA binding domain-containing protein [Devosia enhydra]